MALPAVLAMFSPGMKQPRWEERPHGRDGPEAARRTGHLRFAEKRTFKVCSDSYRQPLDNLRQRSIRSNRTVALVFSNER